MLVLFCFEKYQIHNMFKPNESTKHDSKPDLRLCFLFFFQCFYHGERVWERDRERHRETERKRETERGKREFLGSMMGFSWENS